MNYHTLKLKFQDSMIGYLVSDEVLKWLFAGDYNTYLKRCSILESYVATIIYAKVDKIIKEKEQCKQQ